jgi:hypothetical protein
MTELEHLEQAIEKLPRAEFFELFRRIRERHEEEWDRQIEEDAANGRLDKLWQNAEKEIQGGGLRPLNEVLDDSRLS